MRRITFGNDTTTAICTFHPRKIEPGINYISQDYYCAIHLCPCGCGLETVINLMPETGWKMTIIDGGKVTFEPSIGNFQYPCKSHYYIRNNEVEWC